MAKFIIGMGLEMSKKIILDKEAYADLMQIRDGLVLASNSLDPDSIRIMGRKIESILKSLPYEDSENSDANRMPPEKKCALTVGVLVHAMDDWAVTIGAADDQAGTNRRIKDSGGVVNYIAKVRALGEESLKESGLSKRSITPFIG